MSRKIQSKVNTKNSMSNSKKTVQINTKKNESKKEKPIPRKQEKIESSDEEEEEEIVDLDALQKSIRGSEPSNSNSNNNDDSDDEDGYDEGIEEYEDDPVNDVAAKKLVAQYPNALIEFSTIYDMSPSDELFRLMVSFAAYCKNDNKSTEILSKMMIRAKDLKTIDLSMKTLNTLIRVPVLIRKKAIGILPPDDAIYVNEYNVMKNFYSLGYRHVDYSEDDTISLFIGQDKFDLTRDHNGLWNMDNEVGHDICSKFGKRYVWYATTNKEVHMCFYFLMVAKVKIVNGVLVAKELSIDNPIHKIESANKMRAIKRIRDYMYNKFVDVVSSIPHVTPGSGNDVFSVLVHHCPTREKSAQTYLSAALSLKDMWPEQPAVFTSLTEFLMKDQQGAKDEQDHCKDLMKLGRKQDEVAVHLVNSRSLRGGNKTMANTYLKNVGDIGPPSFDTSTYAKWRVATDGLDSKIKTRKIACIGCTSNGDWWSNVIEGEMTRYDIKAKDPIKYLDILSPQSDVGNVDVIMSDVYLPKTETSGEGSHIAHDFNNQARVPAAIWRLQEKSDASVVVMKCFPARSATKEGEWSIDHLELNKHREWYVNFYLNGRRHNGEFIAFFSKKPIRKGTILCSQLTPDRLSNWLRYLFGVIKTYNNYRNDSYMMLSNDWNVVPSVSLDRLPKGEEQIIEEEINKVGDDAPLNCVEFDDEGNDVEINNDGKKGNIGKTDNIIATWEEFKEAKRQEMRSEPIRKGLAPKGSERRSALHLEKNDSIQKGGAGPPKEGNTSILDQLM